MPVVNEVSYVLLASENVGPRQTTSGRVRQGWLHLRHLVVLFPLRPLVIVSEPIVDGELLRDFEVVLRVKAYALRVLIGERTNLHVRNIHISEQEASIGISRPGHRCATRDLRGFGIGELIGSA